MLYAKLSKWATQEVKFQGHIISKKDIAIDPIKVEALMNQSRAANVYEIQSFLTLSRYYIKFVGDFSTHSKLHIALTNKNMKFVWGEECE